MPLPAFLRAGSAGSFTAATSVATPYPATVSAGDIAFLLIDQSTDNTSAFTWPSGFTEVYQAGQGSTFRAGVAWKRCDGSEAGGTATVNFGGTIDGTSRICLYSGAVTSGTPYEQLGTGTGNSASVTGTAMTTSGPNRLALFFPLYRRNAAGTGTPSGWTQDLNLGANTCRTVAHHKDEPTATTESAPVHTITAANWVTVTLALLPAPVTATLASSLGGLSGSASATPKVLATAASALGGLVGAASAAPTRFATLASTFGALASSASATPKVLASAASSLGGLVSTAGDAHNGVKPIVVEHFATATGGLGALSSSAAAGVAHSATFSGALGGLTGTASATRATSATAASALGQLAAAASATVEHASTLEAALDGGLASTSATVEHQATLSAALGALAAEALGPGAVAFEAALGGLVAHVHQTHSATLAATLGGLASSSSATPEVLAALRAPLGGRRLVGIARAIVDKPAILAAALGGFQGRAGAAPDVQAQLVSSLGALSSSATAIRGPTAVLAAAFGELAASASAGVAHGPTFAAPFGGLEGSASAGVAHASALAAPLGGLVAHVHQDVTAKLEADFRTLAAHAGSPNKAIVVGRAAALAASLGAASSSASASVAHLAALSAPLGALAAAADVLSGRTPTLAAPLGALAAEAAATPEVRAVLAASLRRLSARANATVERTATFAAPLGHLTASASAAPNVQAALAATLGGMVAATPAYAGPTAVLQSVLGALAAQALAELEHPAELAGDLAGLAAVALARVERTAALSAPLGGLAAAVGAPVGHSAAFDAALGLLLAQATATVRPHARRLEVLAGPYNSVLDFNPRRSRLQAGDHALVVLVVRDDLGPIDLSTAPLVQLVFRSAAGRAFVRRAQGFASGRVEYRLAAGELAAAGRWSVQARVVRAGGGDLRTAPREFDVGWNLPTDRATATAAADFGALVAAAAF